MATIIQNVNLANTFGEWVNITNEAVSGYNTIYASDFTKPTGTLYLSSPGTGLSVANTAVFTGLVDVSGQGSLLVRTNAEVQNTIFLTNKAGGGVNSLVLSANGVANINYVNIVGTGLAANVSNNMFIGGTLVITGNTSTSANLVVSKDITGNNQTINYDLNVGEDVSIGNRLTVTGSSTLFQDVSAKQNLEVVQRIIGGSLQANTAANTTTLSVTGTTSTDYLQANTAANTRTLSVTGTASVNTLQANTAANTRTLSVTGTASVNTLQANTLVNTPSVNTSIVVTAGLQANVSTNTSTLSVTGTSSTNYLQANTAANTRTLSVTGTTSTDYLQANTAANTRTLSVTGTASVNTLQANTLVNTPSVNTNIVVTNSLQSNSSVNTAYVNAVSISVSTIGSMNYLQANTAANTTTLSVTGTASVNNLQANTAANTRTLSVTGTTSTDYLQANTAANTRTLSVTGATSTNYLQANTAANTRTLSVTETANVDFLQANTAANTRTLYVTGNSYAGNLISNNNTLTVNLNASGKVFAANLISNTSVITPHASVGGSISVGGVAIVNQLTSNTNIVANSGTLFASGVVTPSISFSDSIVGSGSISTTGAGSFGSMSVSGNFTITGETVYAANTFTLSDGSPFPNTSSSQYGTLRVSRNTANAEMRWDNSGKYWSVRDVDNLVAGGWFNRILTANDNTTLTTSISNNAVSANAVITTANTNMKSYVDVANTNLRLYTNSQITANAASANAVITTANTNMKSYVDTNISTLQTQITANAASANAIITTANTNMKNYVDSANSAMKNYSDNAFLKVVYGSQTVASDLTITGNLTITGTTTTVNATTVETTDSLLKLAKNNGSSDAIDIGFYAPYQVGGTTRHTGLFRKAADKYYLGQGIVVDPITNTIYDYGTNYRATLDANFTGGTVAGLSAPILIADGGSNNTTYTTGQLVHYTGTKLASLANTGTAGTYGSNAYHPVITTDAYGRVSGVSNTQIGIDASQVISGVLPISRGGTNASSFTTGQRIVFNGTSLVSLANSALTAGSYANANTIVVITTNSYGDITGVSNTAISILPTQINLTTGTGHAVLNSSPVISSPTISSATLTNPVLSSPTVKSRIYQYGVLTSADTEARISGGTSNGTISLPTQTPNNTTLFVMDAMGYTGSAWTGGSSLSFISTENITANTRGTKAVITATPAGQAMGYQLTWDGTTLNANGANVIVSGGPLGTPSTGTLTNATNLPIVAGTTGTLSIARGGTNGTSYTAGQRIGFNGTSLVSLANSTISGTYANANTIAVYTTNSYGDITAVTNTAISILPTQINRITGTDAAVLNTSPTFAGAPLAPTAVSGTSNTMIATTEFVQTSNTGLKSYVDLAKAPLASPTLTGAPLAPTAASGTSNTMIATTAFVNASDAALVTAKGYISFYPATAAVFASRNLTVTRTGTGNFTITLAAGIQNGTVNYAPMVGAVSKGHTAVKSYAPGQGGTSAINTALGYALDVYGVCIQDISTTQFVVKSNRNYNAGLIDAGGNDWNLANSFAADLFDPDRITIVVF